MPRDAEKVRRRLQQAALELFQERGYDDTTAGAIAARAGVTERTFFRHFSDKREVFFDGEAALSAALAAGVANAPGKLAPLQVLFDAFVSVKHLFEENRPFTEPRIAVMAATPALRERVAAKTAALIAALTAALQKRGVPEPRALLAAQTGMAAFQHATTSWFADPAKDLMEHLADAFEALQGLSAIRIPRASARQPKRRSKS